MTAKVLSSISGIHERSLSTEPINQNLATRTAEIRRLSTFRSKSTNLHGTLSKGLLAKLGFCQSNVENIVKCDACGFEAELSIPANVLVQKHTQMSPQCQFVLSSSNVPIVTDELRSVSILPISQTNNSNSNFNTCIKSITDEHWNERGLLKAFLNSLSNQSIDKLRENTFSNWTLITPNVKDMVSAGFYYTNIADRVICIECDVLFHKWTETDRPYEIHRLKSPKCRFVLMNEKTVETPSTTNITITTEPVTQTAVAAANPTYSLACRRYESFQNWPQTETNPLPSIEPFVDAGFYYTGEKTVVRCFYCNGALQNWQAGDDPKVEHARWYPQCGYIRQYIGEDLYEAIQRKNRELKAQQNYSINSTSPNVSVVPWTDDEIDRMVKARLDLSIVEKLRTAGFTMAIIRKTFEMQLKFKKDDFKSDGDLQLACLILDLQVKLINGNEANLLVPHSWMKKYTEEQERGPQQIEIPQVQINITETPKVVAQVVTRPKIVQKSDEDSLPCILCLETARQVACLPCGHLTACVACGHSLKTCPICRATVKAFVRIYI